MDPMGDPKWLFFDKSPRLPQPGYREDMQNFPSKLGTSNMSVRPLQGEPQTILSPHSTPSLLLIAIDFFGLTNAMPDC